MTDNTHDDVTRPISIIDRAVELLAPRDEVSRIILHAAVVAAADVTHETGDPDTFAALLVDTVREAIEPVLADQREKANQRVERLADEWRSETAAAWQAHAREWTRAEALGRERDQARAEARETLAMWEATQVERRMLAEQLERARAIIEGINKRVDALFGERSR
jgi:hypothetical protein